MLEYVCIYGYVYDFVCLICDARAVKLSKNKPHPPTNRVVLLMIVGAIVPNCNKKLNLNNFLIQGPLTSFV